MEVCGTGVSVGGRAYTRQRGKAGGLTDVMPGPNLCSLRNWRCCERKYLQMPLPSSFPSELQKAM